MLEERYYCWGLGDESMKVSGFFFFGEGKARKRSLSYLLCPIRIQFMTFALGPGVSDMVL